MIDLELERLVHIRDIPNKLGLPSGKPVHIGTVYRWIHNGVRGVRLECVRVGGRLYTSLEALQRFSQELSVGLQPPPPTLRQAEELREMEVAAVQKRLEERLRIRRPDVRI